MDDIQASLISARNPQLLSKSFRLDADGKLLKSGGGWMAEGTAEKIRLKSVSELATVLTNLKTDQAFCYGISSYDTAKVLTADELKKHKQNGGQPTIARTREHFTYPTGPAILMLDYDPQKDETPLTADEFRETLYGIVPAIRTAPHVLSASASSYIYNGAGCLKGPGGWRILVAVEKGADIPRAGDALFKTCWLKGFGHIVISKRGVPLTRSIIDGVVFQPERLDFCAGAKCAPPLAQKRPLPKIYNQDSKPLDSGSALKSLPLDQESEFHKLVAIAKQQAGPEALVIQNAWIEEQAQKKVVDVPENQKEAVLKSFREIFTQALKNQNLLGDFIIHLSGGDTITVGGLLDNPEKYHGARCADPLEPTYRNDDRIGFINLRAAGRPYIWSYAHGGQRFTLHRARETVQIIDGERVGVVHKVLDLMRIAGNHYHRGGEIVTVSSASDVLPRDRESLLFDLDGLVRFERYDKRSKKNVPCDCKPSIAAGVMAAKGAWGLPELSGVATAPILDPVSGRLIDRDGFDPQSGIMLILNDVSLWPGIPQEPNVLDVERAVKNLWKPFSEFPFVDSVSRGVMLEILIKTPIRALLPTAPGDCITAPTAACGKTLLAKCAAAIAGDNPAMLPDAGDNAEIRKRLLALLRENRRVLVLDNVVGILESSALCAMLTTETYTDRVLGMSETLSVPTKTLLLVTGNNIQLRGDICRRMLTARIDAEMESPWKRKFNLDPAEYCRINRLELIAAALTILRAGIQNGPEMPDRSASFELWSDTVRRAVCLVGDYGLLDVADPVNSIDTAYSMDPETQSAETLFAAWWTEFEDRAITVAKLIKRAEWKNEKGELTSPDLHAALDEIAGETRGINKRKIGTWIGNHKKRIVGGKFIAESARRKGLRSWQLRSVKG